MSNLKMAKIVKALNTTNNSIVPDSDAIVSNALKSSDLGGSTTYYTNVSDLPISAPAFTKALVTSTNTLYQYNGGWYPIALINNFSPSFITEPNATYTLNSDGSATTVTVLAQDSDDVPIKYTVVTNSNFDAFATCTHDSDKHNVWTVTPTVSSGSFPAGTVTFRASDGVNLANVNSEFSIDFGPSWSTADSDSRYFVYPADAVAADQFGDFAGPMHLVSDNTRLIVPAGRSDVDGNANGSNVGSVYILTTTDGWSTWSTEAELAVVNQSYSGSYNTYFGQGGISVDGTGTYLAIGAHRHASNLVGRIYFYSRSGTTWTLDQTITGGGSLDDYYGATICMSHDGTVLATTSSSSDATTDIYTRSGTTWTKRQSISNGNNRARGHAFTDDGKWLFLEDEGYQWGGTRTGRVKVFRRTDGTNTWVHNATIDGRNDFPNDASDEFGSNITCNSDGTVVAIAAADYWPTTLATTDYDIGYAGALGIYTRSDSESSTFTFRQMITNTASQYYGSAQNLYGPHKGMHINGEGNRLFVYSGSYVHRFAGVNYGRNGVFDIWEDQGNNTWAKVVNRVGAEENTDETTNGGSFSSKWKSGTMDRSGSYIVVGSRGGTPPGGSTNTGYVTIYKG